MFKTAAILFLLLTLLTGTSFAQQTDLSKYIGRDITYADMTLQLGSSASNRYVPKSPAVDVYNSNLLKMFIDKGLHKNIVATRLYLHDTDVVTVIERLKHYPTLRFISFAGIFLPDYNLRKMVFPDNIKELQQVEGVELAYPDANISEALTKLKSLKKLSAIAVSAVKGPLPKELLDFKNIRNIGINSSNIRDIDISHTSWQNVFYDGSNIDAVQLNTDLAKLAKLPALKNLELFACNLGNDISVLSQFNHITSFKISGTKFNAGAQLVETLANLPNLKDLTLRFAKDNTQTLRGLEKLKGLRQLTVEGSSLMKSIPDEIGRLSKLQSLKIADCPVKEIPLSIFQLPGLEHLELSLPQLTTLPDGDFKCKKLKSITIRYSKLTNIPNAITTLTRLEEIDIMGNQVSKIPDTGWENLKRLKKADLSSNLLKFFPGGLQQITGLKYMALNGNLIDTMPDLSENNYQLTLLDLRGNQLTSLPQHIGKYNRLQMLYIGQNMLTDLPASLGDCTKLRVFDAEVRPVLMGNDLAFDGKMHIKALPAGLQNTPHLEVLKISGNKGIDATSVFNVILSMPRPNFMVELSDIDLTALPASPKWKDITISRLVLTNNKLITLPVEFASIKQIGGIELFGNLFPGDVTSLTWHKTKGMADLKVLYYEIGVPFPDNMVTNKEYTASLTQFSNDLYSPGKYNKAIKFANMALAVDSATYYDYAEWHVIGTSRYYTGDYKGAIPDFERFIAQVDKEKKTKLEGLEAVIGYYKANAHIQLGQLQQALQTHQYFAKRYNEAGGKQSIAVIYKAMGLQQQYQQMMDSVMATQLKAIELAKKRNSEIGNAILDHAETLIIAGRQNDAIKLLDYQEKGYNSYDYLSIRGYLLATANYLKDPTKFDQLKNELTTYYQTHGKVLYWDFEMFNSWVKLASKDVPLRQAQLMELKEIARYK